MHDPLLVGGFQCLGDLHRDGQGFVHGQRALGDAIRERGPFDQLHHQRGAGVVFESVDRGDVRVVQRCQHSASR
jgi:hypothetical protein